MTSAARARFRQKLLDLRAELLAEGDIAIEPGRVDAAAIGTDDDAQPLTEMSQTIASSRNRERTVVVRRVTAALKRLDGDAESFGLCVECEEPILPKRLELLPYTELCVECQRAHDVPRGGARKSITDYR